MGYMWMHFGHRHTSNWQFINECAIVSSDCSRCFCNIYFGQWNCVNKNLDTCWGMIDLTLLLNDAWMHSVINISNSVKMTNCTLNLRNMISIHMSCQSRILLPIKSSQNSSSQTDCVSAATFFYHTNDLSLFH